MSPKPKIAALLYHDVSDHPFESGFQRASAYSYKHTRKVFSQHLERISNCGTAPEIVTQIDFRRSARHLLLTFDDGGKGALHVSEQLNRFGWKCHFFITTSLIGTRTFLDKDDIRHLRRCGHIVGSHSHTHPDIFRALSFADMIREWRTSCDVLGGLLGEQCLVASVPGGDASQKVFESAAAAGLQYLFTSDPSPVPRSVNGCWIIGRVCAKAGTRLEQVERFAQCKGWAKELMVVRIKTMLKATFSSLYRAYVERALR